MTLLASWLRLPPPQRAMALDAAVGLTLARLLVHHMPMRCWRRHVAAAPGRPLGYHARLTVDGESVIGGRPARACVTLPWPLPSAGGARS